MLQITRTLRRDILPTSVDMGFYHHASDVPVSERQLSADVIQDFGLVSVVFLGVAIYMESEYNSLMEVMVRDIRLQSIMTEG